MQTCSSRRAFLRQSAVVTAALAALPGGAIEPFVRPGKSRFALALAAYSFRDSFKDATHARKNVPAKPIDMFDFVDYCAAHNCAAEVTSYYFPSPLTPDFLLKLKRHAFLRGVPISGSAVGNVFTLAPGAARDKQIADTKAWIDHAAMLAAPHIRIFAGSLPKGMAKDEARKLCIEAITECCEYAGKKGVILGLENHGGIVAEPEDLLDIVRAVNSPWFGINLDTGNFHTDDPYADLAKCAPYAVNVQVKVEIRPRGAKESKPTDLKRAVEILRAANYQGYVALEYEAVPDPWTAVPQHLEALRAALV